MDDAVAAALRFSAANAWSFADRMFKALGWLVALGVLRAVYQRTHSSEVMILGIALGLVWLGAVAGGKFQISLWVSGSLGAGTIHSRAGARGGSLGVLILMVTAT